MSNIPGKWNFINDCIYSWWCFIFCCLYWHPWTPLSPPPPPHHPKVYLLIPCWRYKTPHLANKKKNNNILDLKHVKVMLSLVPQVTQIIFNSPFSMKDFHTNHSKFNWFGYNTYNLSPLSWRLTFYLHEVEYCNFLINYMYETSHIAYTKIANLEGEFIDFNVSSKHYYAFMVLQR
jgi:hypothetical protein